MTNATQLNKGDRITHRRHGPGTVQEVQATAVCVVYDAKVWPHFGREVWANPGQLTLEEEAGDIPTGDVMP